MDWLKTLPGGFWYIFHFIVAVIGCFLFLWIFAWMSYWAQHYGPGIFRWPH